MISKIQFIIILVFMQNPQHHRVFLSVNQTAGLINHCSKDGFLISEVRFLANRIIDECHESEIKPIQL